MEFKICNTCNNEFPATIEFFRKVKKGKYGVGCTCKKCSEIKRKIYTAKNETKKRAAELQKIWRNKNSEKAKNISKKAYEKNKEKYNADRRLLYATDEIYRNKRLAYDLKYRETGKRLIANSNPICREKARLRSKKRREDETKKELDYKRNAIWRKENKEYLNELWKNNRLELKPAYIAQTMRVKVKDLTPEIIETKKNIIKLKRELKKHNIKIR